MGGCCSQTTGFEYRLANGVEEKNFSDLADQQA